MHSRPSQQAQPKTTHVQNLATYFYIQHLQQVSFWPDSLLWPVPHQKIWIWTEFVDLLLLWAKPSLESRWKVHIGSMESRGGLLGSADWCWLVLKWVCVVVFERMSVCFCMWKCERESKLNVRQAVGRPHENRLLFLSQADSCHLKQTGNTDQSLVLMHTHTHTECNGNKSTSHRSKQPLRFLLRLFGFDTLSSV